MFMRAASPIDQLDWTYFDYNFMPCEHTMVFGFDNRIDVAHMLISSAKQSCLTLIELGKVIIQDTGYSSSWPMRFQDIGDLNLFHLTWYIGGLKILHYLTAHSNVPSPAA